MVVLQVLDANRAFVLENRAILRHSVWNVRKDLREVKRCVRIVADSEKQNLSVEIVHAAYGTFRDVRRKREGIRCDSGRLRSGCREGEQMVASHHIGQAPESIGNNPKIRGRWGGLRIEWFVVVPGPGWHHQSTFESDRPTKRLNDTERSAIHRPHGTD
jgi:hypothetical protein